MFEPGKLYQYLGYWTPSKTLIKEVLYLAADNDNIALCCGDIIVVLSKEKFNDGDPYFRVLTSKGQIAYVWINDFENYSFKELS